MLPTIFSDRLLNWIVLICLLSGASGPVSAQNFVPNPGFEEHAQCPEKGGRMDACKFWITPDLGTPDFFHRCANDSLGAMARFGIANNTQGGIEPKTGDGYAGICVYGEDRKEFVQVPLTEPLEARKQYGVRFWVCLSDSSTMGTSDLGVYFTRKSYAYKSLKEVAKDAVKLNQPQLRNRRSNYLKTRGKWECLSWTFTAQGGEAFMTIGNFADQKLTTAMYPDGNRISRTVLRQQPFKAYFLIDDVVLTPKSDTADCKCPLPPGATAPIEDELAGLGMGGIETAMEAPELPNTRKTSVASQAAVVHFQSGRTGLSQADEELLSNLLPLLESNPGWKLRVSGFTDRTGDPENNLLLSRKRATAVADWFVSKGLTGDRIEAQGLGSTLPVDDNVSEEGKARNRRAEVELIKTR